MISKELFCKTIADIQEQDRKISEFDHALGKICDTEFFEIATRIYNELLGFAARKYEILDIGE